MTARRGKLVLGLALVALLAARSAFAWLEWRERLVPDDLLYVSGGGWLYPSPLGRLIGSLDGMTGLAILNVAGAVVLGLAVYQLAERLAGNGPFALACLLLAPAGLYMDAAGVDAAAAGLFVAAVATKGWRSPALAIAACVLHVAIVPFALLLLLRATSSTAVRVTCGLTGLALAGGVLLLTPYRGVPRGFESPALVRWTTVTLILGVGPLAAVLIWLRPRLTPAGWFAIAVAVIAAIEAGAQGHLQIRYELPAVGLLGAWLSTGQTPKTRRATSRGTRSQPVRRAHRGSVSA